MAYQALVQINHLNNYRRALRRERVLRDRINPYDRYNDEEFRSRFRFSKDGVHFIHNLIKDSLIRQTSRSNALSSELQVFITLRYYASGTFQINVGDLTTVAQPTVCKVIQTVSTLLAELRPNYIYFPASEYSLRQLKAKFYEIDQFPNVVGAIDGTHIKISNPGGVDPARFINRKNFFSINTQVICDSSGKILNIVARWPGSAHDSRIFNESNIKQRFVNGEISGILVGDQGYACLPYLITPLAKPNTRSEKRFNKSHIKTRGVIERLFGIWKRRFPVLHIGNRTKLETTFKIIIALAVLQNIALLLNEPEPDHDEIQENNLEDIQPEERNLEGLNVRRNLIDNHFANME